MLAQQTSPIRFRQFYVAYLTFVSALYAAHGLVLLIAPPIAVILGLLAVSFAGVGFVRLASGFAAIYIVISAVGEVASMPVKSYRSAGLFLLPLPLLGVELGRLRGRLGVLLPAFALATQLAGIAFFRLLNWS